MSIINSDNFSEKSESKIKTRLDLFGSNRELVTINFARFSFVTKTFIFSLIYFVFTILFLLISAIISVMVGYFLKQYNLIDDVLQWQLWQKIIFFGGFLFLVANFCLFEAESIVKSMIRERDREKTDDLRKILKIRPKSWQKIFYSIFLLALSLLIGYLAIINYISWNYTQFWE